MVQNIAIISFNKKQAHEVAKMLSEQMEMSFLDTLELFEFDNAPRTQSSMIQEFGMKLYKKKICSAVKYASFFENTVINIEISAVTTNKVMDMIRNNCLVIYLANSTKRLFNESKKTNYATKELKKLYCLPLEKIEKRDALIRKKSDIIMQTSASAHELKIVADIIRSIKDFYGIS